MNRQDFYTGKSFDTHEFFGAHIEKNTTTFRTFAPNARKISLICSYNNWQEQSMAKTDGGGFYEITIPENLNNHLYKYRIYTSDTTFIDHCDPYGFGMELRPNNASFVRDLAQYHFNDASWQAKKNKNSLVDGPMNIYELHLGSWMKKGDGQTDWYTYDELADLLIPYLQEHAYNCIEVLPISEHPMDCSWGYQNTGFFSPTSRYGTALQLMQLIDRLHQADIAVFIDFVPVHFAVDGYGLANYDGTPLYEYPNSAVGVSEWGSCNFMHSRGEVRSFLQSCANYWLTYYHFDGIRMDAISNMIYWQGDAKRGVNNMAVQFLQTMNHGLHELHPSTCLMAEDSTNFPNVTKPITENGLEFDYKWDMGWMNDTLYYFSQNPDSRSTIYHKLTFSMMYFYNEHFLLPLSHDEVVHGKGTIVNKMYGTMEEKYIQARAFYLYMYVHPGKKLNFMGNEVGQLREWDENQGQDLHPETGSISYNFEQYMIALNQFYLNTPALYEMDFDEDGFEWVDCHQEESCIYVIKRTDHSGRVLLAFFNFSNEDLTYELKLNNQMAFTPNNQISLNLVFASTDSCHFDQNINGQKNGDTCTFSVNLPLFSGIVYEIEK